VREIHLGVYPTLFEESRRDVRNHIISKKLLETLEEVGDCPYLNLKTSFHLYMERPRTGVRVVQATIRTHRVFHLD